MSHDIFNASSTATWIECSWSALHAVPEPLRKQSTIAKAAAGTEDHADMEAGEVAIVESYLAQLEPGELYREKRVKITDDCGGTTDVLNDAPRIVTIFDAKFGKWDVHALHNMQLLTYSAAWLPLTDAEWFRLVIFQPNGLDAEAGEDPFKQWVAHRTEVEAHRIRVLRAIADRSPPKPGTHCRWCKAFQQCPAMATDAGFVIGAISRPIESLTTQELVRLLRLIRALGDVKEVYEEALTTHLRMGRTADGVALKQGRAYRAWNDPVQAAMYLHQHYGPKGVKPITPAQAEKLGLAGKQYASVGSHKPQAEMKASY